MEIKDKITPFPTAPDQIWKSEVRKDEEKEETKIKMIPLRAPRKRAAEKAKAT